MNNAFLIEEDNSLKQELETLRNNGLEEDEDEEEEILEVNFTDVLVE